MAEHGITAFPFATVEGSINVPDEIEDRGEETVREYISEHWDEIRFHAPDLDYAGAEFTVD